MAKNVIRARFSPPFPKIKGFLWTESDLWNIWRLKSGSNWMSQLGCQNPEAQIRKGSVESVTLNICQYPRILSENDKKKRMLNKISGSFVRRAGGSSWPAWSGLPANTRPHHSPNTALRCLQPWWLQTIQINSPHRSPPRLHFPKLTKSAKPAAISTLTTLSFPKTYKCLEWTRTNPFSKTYKSWHCGELSRWGAGILMPPPPPTVSGRLPQYSAPTSSRAEGPKFYPLLSSWLTYCSTTPLLTLNMMSSLCTPSLALPCWIKTCTQRIYIIRRINASLRQKWV